jgi:hypothetical protein
MSSNTEKFGWDPGNGVQKAVWVNGTVNTATFPSVAGIGRVSESALTLAGLDSRQRDERPYEISFGGMDYLVGPNVAAHAAPLENINESRFTEGAELRAMFYALAAQLGLGGQSVAVAIALPVELLADKNRAAEIESEMAGWLVGDHRFVIDGAELFLTVEKIRANIAQPLGAWLDWGLDEAGKWTRGGAGRTAPALVIDLGFNTLDLFAVEDGKPSARYTAGDSLGMARAAETVAQAVARRHGTALGLHQVDQQIQRRLAGQTAAIYVHGELVNIGPEIDQALGSLAADVLMFTRKVVKNEAGKFRIILTGGGALALAPRLQRQYPHAEIAADPSLANARGLGKLAISGFLG